MSKNLKEMIGELAVIQKNQMSSDELVKARLASNENIIKGLVIQYENHDTQISAIKDRMDNLELNEEITDEQVRTIQARIKERVSKVLNYPNGDSEKYYQTFISNIYANLRHSYSLGSRTATTKKKHYDTVMRGIEAWHPNIQELKARKDKRDKSGQEG